jgi:fatty acid desaturase
MIITSFSAGLPGLFFILYWLWKNYKIKLEFKSPLKIFISSLVAAIVTFVYLTFISAPAWLLLITGLALFLLVYLVAIPISGAVSQDDINNLRTMLLGMGWMSKILEIPLSFIERLLRKFLPTKKQSEN